MCRRMAVPTELWRTAIIPHDPAPLGALTEGYCVSDCELMNVMCFVTGESVAFFGGGEREGALIQGHYDSLKKHMWRTYTKTWGYACYHTSPPQQIALPVNTALYFPSLYHLHHARQHTHHLARLWHGVDSRMG